jgi:protein-disulfide isomerase
MRKTNLDLVDAVNATDHVRGAPDARVVIVEYGDFECPNCKQAAPAVEMLLNRFAGQVCFVYRHYPLAEVHPHALAASEAAECAAAESRFWEMHDTLFEYQHALTSSDLDNYASQLGLDIGRYRNAMAMHVHMPRIRMDLESGRRSGVRGTPGFFVNGVIQDVSFGLHKLVDATAAALRRD